MNKLDFNADCLAALLMGDDPPQEIENLPYYRFSTSLFKRRLGILAAAQGEGLYIFIYLFKKT